MTIDYQRDILYWVDDYRDTIDYMHLDGTGRKWFPIHRHTSSIHSKLFGITLSQVSYIHTSLFEYVGMSHINSSVHDETC